MEGNVLVAPGLTFHNPNPFEVQVIFERLDWSDEILTAAEVTNWQGFRDLFSNEVLSPNEQVTVGQQIILFTDLRGSTAMYCGIGDAPAYALVREHFTILLDCVRENHGGVVKTIGDAVMAVFSKVPDALRAVREMHEKLAAAQLRPAAEAAGEALILKSSLHIGPCLAVNANDKLDFFGTTINLAARLVDRCKGGDLTVSDAFYHHPDTQAFLGSWPHPAEPFEVQFRGFEAPAKVWRVPILGRAG